MRSNGLTLAEKKSLPREQREILAMKKVAAWVYGEGMTPKAVELRCIEQRELGVWFTADEWGYHYHDSDPAP